jgi:hypothetical protein
MFPALCQCLLVWAAVHCFTGATRSITNHARALLRTIVVSIACGLWQAR